jgi:hypothetical protein
VQIFSGELVAFYTSVAGVQGKPNEKAPVNKKTPGKVVKYREANQ